MKKIFLSACIFALLNTMTLIAQVKIGDLTPPDSSAVLQVVSLDSTKGVLVPEMTVDKRDLIKKPADGLLIYNITEECFNYWNASSGAWQSLCGGVAKATYTVDCSAVAVNGAYVQKMTLDKNDYLSIQVDVIKPGTYTITGTTTNGYGFSTQGTFTETGIQTVIVPGQGQPVAGKNAPGDMVKLSLTGIDSGCSNIMIPVLSPSASYSLNCGSAVFNGAYVKSVALTASNTVTLSVNVSDISGGGTWAVSTNTVNGISFSGNGTFPSTGNQTITLKGTGTPTTTDPITLTFTTNSADGAATCQATVNMAYSPMTIYATDGAAGYGYGLDAGSESNLFVTSKYNFGTMNNSTVKISNLTVNFVPGAGDAALQSALTGPNPPDIVLIGYLWTWSASKISTLINYINNKGVVILFDESSGVAGLFQQLYANPSISTTGPVGLNYSGGNAYGLYPLASLASDPLLTGPFQPAGYTTLGGLAIGSDANGSSIVSGLPSYVITYSTGYTPAGTQTFMFRDPNLNLVFIGDGGFLSDPNNQVGPLPNLIDCPFAVSAGPQYSPVPRTGWTNGTVYNSYLFGNIMAWALNQAQFHGINSSKF